MYKYQKEIDEFHSLYPDIKFPKVHSDDVIGYRFTHSGGHKNDSVPNYYIQPKRVLEDGNPTFMGYALSFYNTQEKAVSLLKDYTEDNPNALKTLGDSVTEIGLSKNDGDLTKTSKHSGHFCLFEFPGCDISDRLIKGESVKIEFDDEDD